METKLIAAELATAAGITTIVMHSANVTDIFGIIDGGVGPSREGTETPKMEDVPLCTRFLRREDPIKEWVVVLLRILRLFLVLMGLVGNGG